VALFDEAHHLKNSATQLYKAADRLPTRLRFALTGTPQVGRPPGAALLPCPPLLCPSAGTHARTRRRRRRGAIAAALGPPAPAAARAARAARP
jgi:hypothetical protein